MECVNTERINLEYRTDRQTRACRRDKRLTATVVRKKEKYWHFCGCCAVPVGNGGLNARKSESASYHHQQRYKAAANNYFPWSLPFFFFIVTVSNENRYSTRIYLLE